MLSDPRYQAGKHLTLVENDHLDWLSNIPGYVVPSHGLWSGMVKEVSELHDEGYVPAHVHEMFKPIEHFMAKCLRLGVSIHGNGRKDLRAVLRAEEEAKFHRDAGRAMFQESQPSGKKGLKDL